MLKHIPMWLVKTALVIAGLIYWEVPQWIIRNSPKDNDVVYAGYHAMPGGQKVRLDNIERDRLLRDSLEADISKILGNKPLNPNLYFELLYRDEARSKRYGINGNSNNFVFMDLMYKKTWENDKSPSSYGDEFAKIGEKYHDMYEPEWREELAKGRRETSEWVDNLPNVFWKIYWTNIIFSLIWWCLTIVSLKRDGEETNFNPISLLMSSLIWPFFFFRSFARFWFKLQAEVDLRRTKINPFSLLTKDERVLIRRFANALSEEREVIREGIRARGLRHSFAVAVIALLVVSFVPERALCAVEKTSIEHVDGNHPPGIEQSDISIVANFSLPEIPSVPIPTGERVSKMYFYFTEKIVQGILFHPEPIPWSSVYFSSNQKFKHIKNLKYEKNKNCFSGTLYRIRYAC